MNNRQKRKLRRLARQIVKYDKKLYSAINKNFKYHDAVEEMSSFDSSYILGSYISFRSKIRDLREGKRKIL